MQSVPPLPLARPTNAGIGTFFQIAILPAPCHGTTLTCSAPPSVGSLLDPFSSFSWANGHAAAGSCAELRCTRSWAPTYGFYRRWSFLLPRSSTTAAYWDASWIVREFRGSATTGSIAYFGDCENWPASMSAPWCWLPPRFSLYPSTRRCGTRLDRSCSERFVCASCVTRRPT